MNPLRFDEVSGRRLHGAGSPLFFAFPTAKPVTTYTQTAQPIEDAARPSYLEDTIIGGRVEGGINAVQIAANGSVMLRKVLPSRTFLAARNATRPTRDASTIVMQRIPNSRCSMGDARTMKSVRSAGR